VSTTKKTTPNIAAPQNEAERLELANQLFREFHARCFWHSPRELVITTDLIPFVVKGLRTHGGHRGFALAGILQPEQKSSSASDADGSACH
jgi:hypothetical protein